MHYLLGRTLHCYNLLIFNYSVQKATEHITETPKVKGKSLASKSASPIFFSWCGMTLRLLTFPQVLYLLCNVFRGQKHSRFEFSQEKVSSTHHQTSLLSQSALTFQIGCKLLYKTSHDLWSVEYNVNEIFLLGVFSQFW